MKKLNRTYKIVPIVSIVFKPFRNLLCEMEKRNRLRGF